VSVGFIKKKFVTMHGHMNVKCVLSCFVCSVAIQAPFLANLECR